MNLLLVEDNRDTSWSTAFLLRPLGWSVYESPSLKDAVTHDPPDAILLDLNLPDSAGKETLDAVRKAFPGSAIVVFTAQSDINGLEGADDVILKTCADEKLLNSVLQRAVQKRKDKSISEPLKKEIIEEIQMRRESNRKIPNGWMCDDCVHFNECLAKGLCVRGQTKCARTVPSFMPALIMV